MELFQANMYSYVAFISRSYTITGEPHVVFIKVPNENEMLKEQRLFLDNIPKGLKVFVETPGNVESVFLVSANVLRGKDSEAIQNDVELMYEQFSNKKYTLNSTTAGICQQYISSIWMEEHYNLETRKVLDVNNYDYVIYTVGSMPFPALAHISKDNLNLIDTDKLVDLGHKGLSLKIGMTDASGNPKELKVFFMNSKTIAGNYVTELIHVCHHMQLLAAGNLPAVQNIELLNKFVEEL